MVLLQLILLYVKIALLNIELRLIMYRYKLWIRTEITRLKIMLGIIK
jgi:hypothetical protein